MEPKLVVVVSSGGDAELREHEDGVPGAAGGADAGAADAGAAVELARVGGDEEVCGGRRRVVVVGAEGGG